MLAHPLVVPGDAGIIVQLDAELVEEELGPEVGKAVKLPEGGLPYFGRDACPSGQLTQGFHQPVGSG